MSKANCLDKTRTLITWEIPCLPTPQFIEMYLNPNKIDIIEEKQITSTRTKGGFIAQYFGENLTRINIGGETGDGGIEALNVLHDVYRSEQLALIEILKSSGASSKRRQSLMQLAASVVMWYQGEGHRGYFTGMSYGETASNGSITYSMSFTSVERIGRRKNFMPYHRRPWSTIETPSSPGQPMAQGGGYGTNYKKGELNMPQVNPDTGVLSDSTFTRQTGQVLIPGSKGYSDMEANLADNLDPLNPASLFANAKK